MRTPPEIANSDIYRSAYQQYLTALSTSPTDPDTSKTILAGVPPDDKEYAILGMRDASARVLGQKVTEQLLDLQPETSAMLCLLLALHAARLSTRAIMYDALLHGAGHDALMKAFDDEIRLASGAMK